MNFSRLLDLASVAEEVNTILSMWIGPLFTALGGVACIYVIILGVQFIRAEGDSKKAEVKSRLIHCIIGAVSLIIIGVVCLAVDFAGLVQIFGYAQQ